jgi:hypothetical protein
LQIDGEDVSRTITDIRDYTLSDVRQLVGYVGATTSFTADTIINQAIALGPLNSTYTNYFWWSTVTTSASTFGVGINTGDILVYSKSGQTVPTYNRVTSVNASAKSLTVAATTSVAGN